MGCASSAPSSANRKKKQVKKDTLRNGGGYSDPAVANIFDEAGNAVREAEEGVISFNEPVNFKALSDAEDYMKSRILDPSRKTAYKFLDKSTTWSPDAGDYLEQKIERDKHRFELKVVKEEVAAPPPVEKVAPKKTKKQRIKSIKKAVKTKKVGLIAEGDAASQDQAATDSTAEAVKGEALMDAVEELMRKVEEDSLKAKQTEGGDAKGEGGEGIAKEEVKGDVAAEGEKEPLKLKEKVVNLDNVLETLLKLEEEKEKAEEEAAAVEGSASEEGKPKVGKEEEAESKAEEEEAVVEEVEDVTEQDDDAMTEVTASSVSLDDAATIAEDNSELVGADERPDSPEVVASSSTAEGKGQEVGAATGDAAPVGNGSAKNETHEGA